jgi:hypothetical protein
MLPSQHKPDLELAAAPPLARSWAHGCGLRLISFASSTTACTRTSPLSSAGPLGSAPSTALRTRRGEIDFQQTGHLHLVEACPHAAGPPRLELGSAPWPPDHPTGRWLMAADGGRYFRIEGVTVSRYAYRGTQIPTPGHPRIPPDDSNRGEPVAEKLARRVRRAARGTRPVVTPTLRPGPTQRAP